MDDVHVIVGVLCFRLFVEEKLGQEYVESRTIEFAKSWEESGPGTPIFFILSAGVNPVKDVEVLGEKMGFVHDKGNYHHISLGQGQEVVADEALDTGAKEGHWVILEVSYGVCALIVLERYWKGILHNNNTNTSGLSPFRNQKLYLVEIFLQLWVSLSFVMVRYMYQ